MKIVIPGSPIAKARPRFCRRGKFVTTYNVQETEEGKALLLCRDQIKEKYSGPLRVVMSFFVKRPQSHYGTGTNKDCVKVSAPTWADKKPDVDNYAKFYIDILNEIAWDDDSQVCILGISKAYSNEPETRIEITKLGELM